MKPYGLRPGDGEKSRRTKDGRAHVGMTNKFGRDPIGSENGPKGKHKAAKKHDERRLVHRQARADNRRVCEKAKKGEE